MKKKLFQWTTLFKITVLFCAVQLLASCEERINFIDRSFDVSGKVTTRGNIYVNAEVPLEIQMHSNVMKKEDVDIVFISSDVKGTLFNSSNNEIKTDAPFKHKFEQPLYLTFKPTVAKELGTLKFKINDKELSIDLRIDNPSHGILFAKEVDTITLGKQLKMQFSIVENKDAVAAIASKAGGNNYTLSAKMLDGIGILVAKEKTLVNNTAQLTSPMGLVPMVVSKTTKEEIALTKEELINAVFIPLQGGRNTIQFSITDSYGNTVNQTRTMQAVYDSMSLKFISTRDVAEVGKTLLYDMILAMDGYTGNFRFHPTLISGAGILKVDGVAVPLTSPFTVVKPGTKKLIFEPTGEAGDITIAFQVYDDFGGFVYDTLRGRVENNSFKVTTTLAPQTTVKYTESIPIVVGISQEAQSAQYSYIVKSNVEGVLLKKENTAIEFDKSLVITSGLHNFTFTGAACGDVVLTFEVKHATQDKTVTLKIPIKVSAYPLSVNLLNQSATTTRLNVPVTFDLQFETEKAPETAIYYITPKVTGALGVLGSFGSATAKKEGDTYKAQKGTHQFTYTPFGLGEHTVEFEVYDGPAFGQRKTVSAVVNVMNAEIVVTPSATALDTHINENKGFNINVSEEDYTGRFKLSYTGGTGDLKTSMGQTIAVNTPTAITKGTTILSYTPKAIGTETLKFIVTDDNNQSKEFAIVVTSTHVPMTFTASIAGNGYNGRSYNVPLSFSGAGPYKVSYTITGSGTVKHNNQPVDQDATVSISNSENWTFEPVGNATLNFTAIDKNGQSKTASATIQSRAAAVSASMSSPTSTVEKKNNVTSYLRISNEAGDNVYGLTVSGDYNGSLNIVSGTDYTLSNGQIGLTFNPNTIDDHTITITATDKFGQAATTTWKVNAVPAEINVSMSGGASNYIGFAQSITVNVNKPNYSSGYTMNLSSNNSGTFSQTTFDIAGNIGSRSFTYTPTAVGNHTLTATITDLEGKSKSVAVTLSTPTPSYDNAYTREKYNLYYNASRPQFSSMDYSFVENSGANLAQYPAGSSFSYTLNGEATTNPTYSASADKNSSGNGTEYMFTLKVTDRWGQSWTKSFCLLIFRYGSLPNNPME